MKRALALVVLTACGQVGVTVDVSAASGVPALDALRVQVTQGDLLVAQTFPLEGKMLPQSVAVVSKGLTKGTVGVTVQGLSGGIVQAVGSASAMLAPASSGLHVAVELTTQCADQKTCKGCAPAECTTLAGSCGRIDDHCGGQRECGTCSNSDICANGQCIPQGCLPKSCADAGAQCGQVPDGCGGHLECGGCDAGLNCGGADAPNHCGPGPCDKRLSCDAGVTCGTMSDGCGSIISCGGCDAGVCGSNWQCGCTPGTCPSGICGAWPDGCGRMLNCGGCDAGLTCGGGSNPNACGCTPKPTCPPGACNSWPDGCGGMTVCPMTNCGSGQTCVTVDGGGSICACPAGKSLCGAACVNVQTDSNNCGMCNHVCPGGQQCSSGLCPCVDAGSNADGHCCPPGWNFLTPYNADPMRCYLGPFDAGTHAEALATCEQATLSDYGRGISALGQGDNNNDGVMLPIGACGAFWHGPGDTRVTTTVIAAGREQLLTQTCNQNCTFLCSCDLCNCQGFGFGCEQPFYCVMDPLGPRREGPCVGDADCPPGDTCVNGVCTHSALPICANDADCDAGSGHMNCQSRTDSEAGLCR